MKFIYKFNQFLININKKLKMNLKYVEKIVNKINHFIKINQFKNQIY